MSTTHPSKPVVQGSSVGPGRRRRVGVLAVAIALASLSGCTGVPDGVQPVRDFDAARYAGTWYSIARLDHSFERDLTHVSATYSARPDGRVGVVNRGLDPRDCRWRSIEGTARFLGARDVGSLGVSFFGPFTGGYHVIALDPDGYRWAMVSGPTRDYLWILARTPTLDAAIRERLVAQAAQAGFPVGELTGVEQGLPARCADGREAPPVPAGGD
ncbi:MAG: lipocalin family protein [Steroidobacteraceae bacterium]|jgi:apolipoprotein D and lipocalin family protein|nr:lipocalin family protein [Steroidobacteraceae bacterium]